jgi:hypothetical protein
VHSGEGVTSYGAGDENTLTQGGGHRARLADEPGLGAIMRLWKLAEGKAREGGPSAPRVHSTPVVAKGWKTQNSKSRNHFVGYTNSTSLSMQICRGSLLRR